MQDSKTQGLGKKGWEEKDVNSKKRGKGNGREHKMRDEAESEQNKWRNIED